MPKRSPAGRLLLLVLVLAAGCERPFVDTDPVVITETAPDLSVVQTAETLPLRLRVSDAEATERVTVNGATATRATEAGVFLDTLRLDPGLNPLFVAVFDDEGRVTEDTLYAAYLPYATGFGPALPEGRSEHTATALPDGRVLVAGGFEGAGAVGSALLAEEAGGAVTLTPLADGLHSPRGGHTATRLPDGRVLLLCGGTRTEPNTLAQFVAEAELYDPATRAFTVVPFDGEPLQRYGHAALALESAGHVFVYVYGGVAADAGGVAPTGTLAVLELREAQGADVLTVVSPPGGIGAFPPTYGHALLPLPSEGGLQRALAVGADLGGAEPAPFALRLTFRPSSTFSPFEIETEDLAPPDTALARFGAAEVAPGLVLLSGGLVPPSTAVTAASGTLRLYADAAGRFFTFPASVGLRIPRARHTETFLPSGRILVVGGVSTGSGALAQTELIGSN